MDKRHQERMEPVRLRRLAGDGRASAKIVEKPDNTNQIQRIKELKLIW